MVDQGSRNNGSKIKHFMDSTPSFIKSKFLSVLGTSNDLINGISTKLEFSLSQSTTDSECAASCDRQNANDNSNVTDTCDDDESWDENIIDFDSRKVKERRAYEEIKSGRYRQPNFITRIARDECNIVDINQKSSSPSDSNSDSNNSRTKSLSSPIITSCPMNTSTNFKPSALLTSKCNTGDNLEIPNARDSGIQLKLDNESSVTTSENDLCIPSTSIGSSNLTNCMRSESLNSVPSWASSISLDCQSDETIVEFMKNFVQILYEDSTTITLDIKSEFGHKARTETGRLWFARLVSSRRGKNMRVEETTFYSLIQFFAIVLFECCESEDYSPAKILMNMCFTFYHEIDVPGCEPYREYLYTYLREQQIWQSLRFWNAAFFDALQNERILRPVLRTSSAMKAAHSQLSLKSNNLSDVVSTGSSSNNDLSLQELNDDQQFHQNISFGQLGTFTCNMHAFGIDRELCSEFLRKQCVIANLSKDQEKMLRDNINRMYKETAKWRT